MQARGLWDEWSKGSTKYDPTAISKHWSSFSDYGGITLSTLFMHAKANGWIEREEEEEIIVIPAVEDTATHTFDYRPPEGILRDMYDWALETSPVPQPGLALSACLAVGSFVLGRSFVAEPGVELNMYFLNVGESGSGKDHPRNVVKKVAMLGGWSEQIGEDVFSGSAIYTAMQATNKRMYLLDEFGLTLQRGLSAGNGNHASLIKALLSIYTGSATTVSGADYASKEIKTVVLNRPCLVMIGSTTPQMFYDALTSGDADNGFLPRIMAFSAGPRRMPRDVVFRDPPYSVLKWMEDIEAQKGQGGNLMGYTRPIMVPITKGARAIFDRFSRYAFDRQEGDRGDLVWSRAAIILKKVSTIVACMGPQAGVPAIVEADAMKWSADLVSHQVEWLEATIKDNIADSNYHRMRQEVLAVFRRAGRRGLTDREIARGNGLKHINPKDREQIIKDLKETKDIILVESTTSGRKRLSWIVTL